MTPEEIARDIRDIYLHMNRNYTLLLSLDRMKRKAEIEDIIPAAKLAEVQKSLKRLAGIRRPRAGSLSFTSDFDFVKNNREVNQIIYGQKKAVSSIRKILTSNSSASIVSLGIGDGKIASLYMKGFRARLTGFDLHREYLAAAKKLIPALKPKIFDLNRLSLRKLPIPESSADIAECIMTGHHIENFQALLQEINRILKKGGVFFYLDLVDKTHPEPNMTFHVVHGHPPYHGIEFFRSHTQVKSEIRRFFKIQGYERIGPGIVFIEAVK